MNTHRTYIEVEFPDESIESAMAYAEELARLLEFEGMDVRAWHHKYELYELGPWPMPPFTPP
jgi:hypothetical protein